jgi:hypothetical protein
MLAHRRVVGDSEGATVSSSSLLSSSPGDSDDALMKDLFCHHLSYHRILVSRAWANLDINVATSSYHTANFVR